MVPINHVGPTLTQLDSWKRIVGIMFAYVGLVGLKALDQQRTKGWQLSWPDEWNVICRRRANKTADKMLALSQQMIAICVSCLLWFETKNKIRCIDASKYAFTHRKLPKSISELFKMYMKSLDSFILIVSRATRHAFTETVEFLDRAQPRIMQCLWEIAAVWFAVFFIFLFIYFYLFIFFFFSSCFEINIFILLI